MNNRIKVLVAAVGLLLLAWGAPGVAEMNSLTDNQMDSITAGSASEGSGVSVDDVKPIQKVEDPKIDQKVADTTTNPVKDNQVDALNVAIAPETTANTVTLDNSVNAVILSGDALEHAKAVSIVTGVSNKVGTGVNAHAIVDRGLGGLLDSSLSNKSGSLDGGVPFINQSNIIIQQR
jgi:hypothetical protein